MKSITHRTNRGSAAHITLALFAIAADGNAVAATPSGFDFGAYATGSGCGALTISGNAYTDSFDSSQGSYSQTVHLSQGLVGSSGNVALNGNVTVNGAIFALNTTVGSCMNGNPGISLSGMANATGGYIQLNAAPVFPNPGPVTPGSQDYTLTSDTTLAPGNYGNITVSGNTLTLSPGTYNINSLTLSGKGNIVVKPSGQVLVNIAGDNVPEPIEFSGGGAANPGGVPLNLYLSYGGMLPITISGGSGSYAVLYAPNSAVTLGADWFGAMVVQSLNDSGGSAIHYDRSLAIPPTITGAISTAPNAAGWNNSNVTVTFTCADPILGIASCSSPVQLTMEGANQAVSGTAVNRAGFSATTKVNVSIDKTPPAVSISSPSNGITVTTTSLSIMGTATDALSGVASVACQGTAATLNGSNFTCTVSLVPGSNTITVQATDKAGNSATASVTITLLTLTITDFSPKSAPIGTLVTATGNGFVPAAGAVPQLSLSRQGGGTLHTLISSVTNTNLTFVIPSGAATGTFSVTVNGSSATSPSPLTITPSSTFTLSAAPPTANVIQGQSAAYAISLSTNNGFDQLAVLSVAGLPSGITGSFNPSQITAGQNSILTVNAPTGQATGPSILTVSAAATIGGVVVTQSSPLTLNVMPVTTSLLGRTVVSDSLETPLAGVTIKMLGLDGNGNTTGCTGTTLSDGAGNFALTNPSSLCIGPQLVGYDGTTATSPSGKYAGVNLVYTLVSGQAIPAPVLIHLPRIDNQETFMVQQNAAADQSYSYKTIPNLSVTVYAGTTFTMPDGTQPNPFPLTAINVPPDRLPDIKPPVPTMITAFIVAFQPANATTNQPVAVYYPNPLSTAPGMDMALLTLDPTHGAMVPYGTGAVSADGTQIVPDPDPAHPGHRYGLVHFDWHMPGYPLANQKNPCPVAPQVCVGKPIDVSSGLEVVHETDLSFGGSRGTISLQRIYRNAINPEATTFGPFGYGSNHNFGYELAVVNASTVPGIPLIMPDGNQILFSKQSDGTFVNTSGIPSLAGAVMTLESPSEPTVNLRWKDGTTFRFLQTQVGITFRTLLDSITDANGNRTQLRYSGFLVTDIIDPVGRDLHFDYSSAGKITRITAPDGRFVSYDYADSGLGNAPVHLVTHPDGTMTRYDYDSSNNLIAVTDGRGVVVESNTYDSNNRVIQQVQANGGLLKFSYVLQNPTAPATSPVMTTTVTDALGHQTVYRFSPNGALISVMDALGRTRTFGRDGANNVTSITGAATCGACGDSTSGDQTFSYDGAGNLLSQTDALGNTTSFTYDPTFNKVTSIKDPLGNLTTFTYDTHGNLLSLTDADHNTTSYQYDQFGELIASTDAMKSTTHFSYDTLGNLSSIQDPLTNTTSFQYDIAGRLLVTQDALGRRTSLTYDSVNRIISQTNAQNALTQFAYDKVGNLLSVTNSRSQQTSFTYDAMNGLKTRTDALSRTDTRSYDLNENLMSFTDRRSQTNTFTYDQVDRLTGESYQDGSIVVRTYDANDRLVNVNDSAGGVFTFSYDSAGRLTGSANPNGVVQYIRDGLGRATSRQVVGQAAVSYLYDAAGNLTSAAMPQASATFKYDPRNLLSNISRLNGVSSAYAYDQSWRLMAITHANGANMIDAEGYGYDAVGNRTSHSTSIGQPSSTPAIASAAYDGDDEQNQFGLTANTFDANGNLVSTTNSSGTSNFTWDSRNRLKSIITSAGQATNFTYDFAGNLIQQADAGSSLTLTKSFLFDDLTNIAYETASDGTSYNVLSGRSIDSHLGILQSSGQALYGLTDGINSTIATTDQSGSAASGFIYDAFGQTGLSTSPYPFRFAGRPLVSANLYYNRARFYNSQTGRFISEDPIGFAGGPNLYSYVRNSPIGRTDPSGAFAIGVVVGGLYGGLSGALGSYAQGGNWRDVAVGGLIGAGTGAAIGALDPSEGVGTIALIGGLAGAAGDVAGQLVGTGGNFSNINWYETAGAGIGAALGGYLGGDVALSLLEVGYGEWTANIVGGLAGLIPSTYGGWLGQIYGRGPQVCHVR